MAKLKHAKSAVNSPQELRGRIDRCIHERRFQTALELAKQLNKFEPTAEHRELVVHCYFGRAKQLREQGSTRDAATVLDAAVQYIGDEPARLIQIAEELAAAGEVPKALQIMARVPEPKPPNRVLALVADAAIQRGANGRAILPESLRLDFDRVRQGFALLEKGQDDAARETIQGIGLSSPFLEWKLFLRGLQAYYQNDDARAVENWSRLDSARFAARLAAPLRLPIDAAFRNAQPPEAQERIARQGEKLQGNALAASLKSLRRLLHGTQGMMPALRDVQSVRVMLKQQRPDLDHRLADIFYWEIIDHGAPEDRDRYRQIFGAPADDPAFARMNAMAMEADSAYQGANEAWKSYEEFLARHPKLSGPERQRARGMVWYRMATNAQKQADLAHATENLPLFPFGAIDKPRPLKPSAEECLRKSIELAPDWLEPHAALFDVLQEQGKAVPTIQAGYKLLKLFPDHLPTLERLAELERCRGKIEAAGQLMERAYNSHPLDRGLKRQFGRTRRLFGLELAKQGRYAEAREAFREALQLIDPIDDLMPLCGWAACEFKAGDAARAEELLAQANQREENRPAIAAYMAGLAADWKLPKAIKSRFDKDLKTWLSATPTPAQAASLALLFAGYQSDDFDYYGRKTHEKKMLALAGTLVDRSFTEPEMKRLGDALSELEAQRLLRKFALRWQRDFPTLPQPLLYEIDTYLWKDDARWPLWRLKPLAEEAKHLAEKMPAGAEREAILARIDDYLEQFHDLNPFASLFDQFAGGFDEGPDDNWEDQEPW